MTQKLKRKGFVKAGSAALEGHPQAQVYVKAMQKNQALQTWGKAVVQFFEEGAEKTRAINFKDGVLYVACLSRELAGKIKLYAQRILYVLNQLIGKQVVYALNLEY